ncbi:hypothetical protein JMJ35_007761 [Cladonia borealis]|uniref:Uncharacterized protein n=1 Tax=Cladonia borealis TaxID=184061 RepID=A0AA39UZ63_9LECA|nr:hypothetical protein JMJ35_007761 [Cladonia borealis]
MHAVSILLQAIILSLAINALPSLGRSQIGQILCQSTAGSPLYDDVTGAINQLFGESGSLIEEVVSVVAGMYLVGHAKVELIHS